MKGNPILDRAGRAIARSRRAWPVRRLAGFCRWYLAWHGNANYDFESNGEARVLDALSPFPLRTIFDVGANVGDWSLGAHARFPQATIHAFEISEPTCATLLARTASAGTIRCRNVGLADREETVTIRHFEGAPALTTATDYPHELPSVERRAQVIPGDRYVREEGIETIDFLKIDVEGMEERVLRGFEETFRRGAVEAVQFEYGRVNILSRFLLRDFDLFFRERGYALGKIYPDHVDFRAYRLDDEDFLGPNYLAVREERSDWIDALAGEGGRP